MPSQVFRIGQIVPSSNTTMETEVPAMLHARAATRPDERFTVHSSRMRMKRVTREDPVAMNAEGVRCAAELADARVDVMSTACLVAIMANGAGCHRQVERDLTAAARVKMLVKQGTTAFRAPTGLRNAGAVQVVHDRPGLPVVATALCTARGMLDRLGLDAVAPGAGAPLSGRYPPSAHQRLAG